MPNEKILGVAYLIIIWIVALIMIFSFSSLGAESATQYYLTAYNPNVSFRSFNNNSCAIITTDCIASLSDVHFGTVNVNLNNFSYCSPSSLNPSSYHGLNLTTAQYNNTFLNATFYSGNCQYYGLNSSYAVIQVILINLLIVAFAIIFSFFVIKKTYS